MLNNPYFGIIISFITYEIGVQLNKRLKSALINPLLISIILTIAFLKLSGTDYKTYMEGGKFVLFLIAPATVALMVPLYRNFHLLKANFLAIFIGSFIGSLSIIISVLTLSKIFKLSPELIISLLPKSITTAIGIPLSQEYGGLAAITAICIIITGILGSVIGPFVLKAAKIDDEVAFGVAMGTAAHAIGTSRAMEIGEVEGAMSGLCIGIAGIMTVFILPLAIKFVY